MFRKIFLYKKVKLMKVNTFKSVYLEKEQFIEGVKMYTFLFFYIGIDEK